MKNEYTITKKLMKSWAKGWYFNSADNMFTLLFTCFWMAVAIIFPYLFVHLAYFMRVSKILAPWFPVFFGAFHIEALLFVLLMVFIPRMRYALKYNILRKNYSVESWQRSIELTDGEIIVKDHRSIFKYQYRTIRRVKVRGNVVHIFLKSGTEIIIHKDAFVSGSWDECKKLISQKSRVKIK